MTDVHILPYESVYLPEIAALERECFSTPWSANSLREAGESECTCFLVALQYDVTLTNGRVIGFGCVTVVAGEAELLNIAISPVHRREGFGGRLLSALLEEAMKRGAEKVFLEVREGNVAARTLYQKYGFTEFGVRRNYYKQPVENAVLMERIQAFPKEENDNVYVNQ